MGDAVGLLTEHEDEASVLAGGQSLIPLLALRLARSTGFCTPGFLMSATAYLDAHPEAGEWEIREALSGNTCRCTGNQSIIDGALLAARRRKEG